MSRRNGTLKLGWRELWPVWLVFGILIAIGALGIKMTSPTPAAPRVLLAGEDLRVNLSDLNPAEVHLFAYPLTPRNRVEFFVERSSASGITVAFASCRRCYRSGHYQQAGQILCGHCNEPMERLSAGQSPGTEKDCKQIPIPFEQSGDRVIVRANTVRDTFARWYAQAIPSDGTREAKQETRVE